MSFVLVLKQLCVIIKNTDVAYGIGAIKRNVKNVAVFFFSKYYVENTKITPSTCLNILLRNRE